MSRGPSCAPLLVVLLGGVSGLLRRRLARELLDLGGLDARQVLAVPGAAAIAALGLELEHAQLLAADVLDDLGVDLDLRQAVGVEDDVVGAEEDRLERHRCAGLLGQALDQQGLALLDAVLLTAGLDDRVHVSSQSEEVACALAAERRRPPLRPRRRGVDSTASSPEPSVSASGA